LRPFSALLLSLAKSAQRLRNIMGLPVGIIIMAHPLESAAPCSH
jgi:hypothetical protein